MSKTVKITMITILAVAALTLSFVAGCTQRVAETDEVDLRLDVINEAWGIIFQEYVDRDRLESGALSQAAIEGMVEALDDPYTSYLSARAHQLGMEKLEGKFEGIGAYVGIRDEQLVIISPIAGSPAAQAGIKAGDVVIEVDGKSTTGMSLEEAVMHIRGPKGTAVTLLVLHQDETEAVAIEIVRDEIEVESVFFEMKGDIAYIHINHFSERTEEELSSKLEGLDGSGARGIILDLRMNPGGLLNEVVAVAGHFLEEEVVVHVVDNQGEQTSSYVGLDSVVTDLPMVVLVDEHSASGSEVLAGALQDHGRAVIAGTVTFGKGSVNTLYELKDGSGLYITTARWLTPDGRLIEGKGITPDYELELEGEDAIQWAIDYLGGSQ